MNVCFVTYYPSEIDGDEGQLLSGSVGEIFDKEYLEPLELDRRNIFLLSCIPRYVEGGPSEEDIYIGIEKLYGRLECINSDLVIALGYSAQRALKNKADIMLPHPIAIYRNKNLKDFKKKLEKIKFMLKMMKNDVSKQEEMEGEKIMPIKECQLDGQSGFKWGDEGKCYTYEIGNQDEIDEAKRLAFEQGIVIEGSPEAAARSEEINNSSHGDKDEMVEKSYSVGILKSEDEKRLVYGIVLEPDRVDAHGDVVVSSEIEKAAHGFMIKSRLIGDNHMTKAENVKVAESYISPVDFDMENQRIIKGSWIIVVKVDDDEMWKAVKDGEYTGFSIGATGYRC